LAKPAEVKRTWYLVDATDIPLGRLASQIAVILMGKNKPIYTPNVDTGDYVVVINAAKVKTHRQRSAENTRRTTTTSRSTTVAYAPVPTGVMHREQFPTEMVERASGACFRKEHVGRQIVWQALTSTKTKSTSKSRPEARRSRRLRNKEKDHG
jgi:large subunit ribosomal protein L13